MELSVIMPVWNTGKNAVILIENLLNQYDNLEIIVVDDGSTDDSLKMMEEVARSSLAKGRVKVVPQENAGVSAARNTGIKLARGKYLYFMDSDDEIKEGMLKKLFDMMEENPKLALVATGMEYRKLALGQVENTYISHRRERRKSESLAAYMLYLLLLDGRMYGVINKLFRMQIVRENKLEFEVGRMFAEDTNFVLDYLKCAPGEIAFILEPLYVYNFGTETSIVKKSATIWKNWQESYDYLKRWAREMGGLGIRGWVLLRLVKIRWRVSYLRAKKRAQSVEK